MSAELITCGLNHKTAPIELRERVFFSPEHLKPRLKEFSEAVILSTCNRTEIYSTVTEHEKILKFFSPSLKEYLYVYQNQDVVKHALRVASGLDSMVLGEPQVLGQLKTAVNIADQTGTLGFSLRKLFDHVFLVAKQVRTETEIGMHPVSLGHAVLQLAKNIFEDISKARVLFIGAGEIIENVSKYFQSQNLSQVTIANRTLSHTEKFKVKSISLSEISDILPETDIVISAIHHVTPVIGKGMVETALRKRKHKPILMVDLAVPRNIEPEIKTLEDIYLYNMDDLQNLLQENYAKRKEAVVLAENIIDIQTQKFYDALQLLKASRKIQSYRNTMHKIRDEILQNALRDISLGDNPTEVVERMAYLLTNKLIHEPSQWLKYETLP